MNAVESDVEKLVQKELESANQRFPMFRSNHEGSAVILEEIEEVKEEMELLERQFDVLWENVKLERGLLKPISEAMYSCAIRLACEAIQVAAMAQKFIDSQKEREKSEDN